MPGLFQAARLLAPRAQLRPEPGFDVRTAQPLKAQRRAAPQRPLGPRAPPGGREDSGRLTLGREESLGHRKKPKRNWSQLLRAPHLLDCAQPVLGI